MFSKRYKVGYSRSKAKTGPAENLVVPMGPILNIQPLDDSKVDNGHETAVMGCNVEAN